MSLAVIRWSARYLVWAMTDDFCWTCVKPRWCCDCRKAGR